MEPWQIGVVVGAIVGPFGAAWAGIRVGLNGTRESVVRIESKVDKVVDRVTEHGTRIAVLESKEAA